MAKRRIIVAALFLWMCGAALGEEAVSIALKAVKEFYEPNEPVEVMLAIANHGEEPVYIQCEDPNNLPWGMEARDSNGADVPRGPLITPPPPPGHHYMSRDGERILTDPLCEIRGHTVRIVRIADAIRERRKYMGPGEYYLSYDELPVIHHVGSLIRREDVSPKLWMEVGVPNVEKRYNVRPIKIEIGVPEERPAATAVKSGVSWECFGLGGLVGVIVGAALTVIWKRRGGSPNEKPAFT